MSKQVKKQSSLLLLMVNLFVVMMGIGLVIPILPYYIEWFGASSIELGALIAIYSFMQFLLAPFWGRMSDKYGRKPLIALGMFGFATAEFIFAFATELWMLFFSRILAGTFGSAIMPAAMAYVSDTTTPEKRGQGMGLMGAAMALGIVVGPGIGGWLAEINLSVPFLFAGVAGLLAGLFSIFLLPESLPKELRSKITHGDHSKANQWTQMLMVLKSPAGFLLVLILVLSFGLANFQAIFGLYALHRFQYNPSQVGMIMVLVGLMGAVAQGGLVGKLTKLFGEEKVIVYSLLASGVGFIIMLLAFNFITVMLTTSVFFLGNSLLRPAINSMISKLAGNQQGLMMGLNNSFFSLGNVLGALLAGVLFDLHLFLPYIVGALTMFLALIATTVWMKGRVKQIAVD